MRQTSPDPEIDTATYEPPARCPCLDDGTDARHNGHAVSATLLVGHPTAGSRTLGVATHAARTVCATVGEHGVLVATPRLLDLCPIAPQLLDGDGPAVRHAIDTLRRTQLLVVASPTFKGSYTGLLKTFLDLLPQHALDGVVAVPLMTAAASRYRFAVDAYLATVLVELGADVPCRGLSLLESEFPEADKALDSWCATAAPVLAGVLGHRTAQHRT